jgi:hypothetical protein
MVSAFTVEPDVGGIFTAVGPDDIETDVMRGFCQAMPTIVQTVLTDVRVNGLTLQYKSRDILIFPDADESDWTTWHTGEDCTA